jgi:hypothetical protein
LEQEKNTQITTGNAAFAVRSNLCRASYSLTYDKDSLPCVLISGAQQRFFSFLHFGNKRPLVFAVRFNFRRTAKIFSFIHFFNKQ